VVEAVGFTQHSQTDVDGDADEATGSGGLLVAFYLAEHSQADVDGHADERTAVAAGGAALVALGLAQGSEAGVDRHIDQTTGDRGLLVAGSTTENSGTKTQGDANQAFGLEMTVSASSQPRESLFIPKQRPRGQQ
jgi:uncharacterized membrane protein